MGSGNLVVSSTRTGGMCEPNGCMCPGGSSQITHKIHTERRRDNDRIDLERIKHIISPVIH